LPNAPPAVIAGTVPKRVWEDLLGRGRRHAPFIDACGSAAYVFLVVFGSNQLIKSRLFIRG